MNNKIEIPFVDLKKQWSEEKSELLKLFDNKLAKEDWVNGESVNILEDNLSNYIGCKNVVTLNSGTDALTLALSVLGVQRGDEVITVSNSFIATVSSIVHLGAVPVLVDVDSTQNIDVNLIESKISSKTVGILAVHLTGRMANMEVICQIAKKNKLFVIEDAAQAIGSSLKGVKAGNWGDIGCFSTHPLKNLNALGDGGFVTTNDSALAQKIIKLRNHGMLERNKSELFGFVSRMDTIQAIVLNYRLSKLNSIIEKRRQNATYYNMLFSNIIPEVSIPDFFDENYFDTYHLYVIKIEKRNDLKAYLEHNGIGTAIHYPIPIHLQQAYLSRFKKIYLPKTELQSNEILSIPINQFIDKNQIELVVNSIKKFRMVH